MLDWKPRVGSSSWTKSVSPPCPFGLRTATLAPIANRFAPTPSSFTCR